MGKSGDCRKINHNIFWVVEAYQAFLKINNNNNSTVILHYLSICKEQIRSSLTILGGGSRPVVLPGMTRGTVVLTGVV